VRHRSRIAKLVKSIVPAIRDLDPKLPPGQLLKRAIEANVRWTVNRILESPEGKARIAEGSTKLMGAIYELRTGRVKFLR
jgi:carbonic anhydrase